MLVVVAMTFPVVLGFNVAGEEMEDERWTATGWRGWKKALASWQSKAGVQLWQGRSDQIR